MVDGPRPALALTSPSSPRLVMVFLACAAALFAGTAWLTLHLTRDALEDRVRAELMHTARLLGGGGFPLTDPALRQVSNYLEADVVALDAQGEVLASSLSAADQDAFEAARARGDVPAGADQAEVVRGRLGDARLTLGVAPVPNPFASGPGGPARGTVYVLYPEDLLAEQSRRAWLPLIAVAGGAALLAAALGVLSQRMVERARTAALLRLLTSVAHEVRNPLGAIRTLARSLRGSANERDGRSLDLIAAEADRLTLLVDGLRAVGTPVRALRREVDPDAELSSVLALVEHQLAHRRVRVSLDPIAAPTRIEGDPAQLRQVLLNLILNAADAMPRGGTVRLERGLKRASAHDATLSWQLTIEDEGPGVPPDVRARLFQPFVTTKPKGLGIGLYLSRRLLEANGGTLELSAGAGRGARFVVRWPALEGAPLPAPAEPLAEDEGVAEDERDAPDAPDGQDEPAERVGAEEGRS